ncbi:uncharacterized protein BX664DRAFT_290652 [Halteromyces radiatus]|uniref:uncharacterized protein n=1 Tax=Halteromyces radiatus TaxID=101107 RepID=UPI002220FBA8|nr:uncharacterized protein BX664DRAFT_290652 [Halteromyces radiatus]KAI8100112.1 hypothetical protein BX664DRAFT_290652 [Halteromyces radiatus]
MARHHHHHHHHHNNENGNGHVKHSESNGQATKEGQSPVTNDNKKQQQTKAQFVSRVTSIPLVHDSVSSVSNLANKTSLGRFAFATANSTYSTVSKYTSQQPAYVQSYYESYVQPHLEKADQLGCKSLDLIQSRFPVVNEPTSKLIDVVRQPSYQVIDGVKVRLDTTLTTVRAPADYANKQLVTVVDNVEALVHRYLPHDNDKTKDIKKKKDESEVNQIYRAYGVLNEATLRLTQRVTDQVKSTASQVPKSRDDLAQWANASALIQTATTNLQSIQTTLTQSVTVYVDATQRRLPPAVTERIQQWHSITTERLQGLSNQVSIQLNQVVSFVKTQSQPPQWLKDRVLSLVDIANHQFDLVRAEYARTDIASLEKAKNVAYGLQTQVVPVLQNIQSQLTYYSQVAREKAQADLKVPLDFLGFHAQKAA